MKTNSHQLLTCSRLIRATILLILLLLPAGLCLAGSIYWVDSGTNKIQKANLDGTNPEDVMSNMTGYPGNPVGSASGLAEAAIIPTRPSPTDKVVS